MIDISEVSFTYQNGENGEGLQNINLHISKGEVVLLCGESGCGKTTLTRLVNGLIPHFFEGKLEGTVTVGTMNPPIQSVQKTSSLVGSVFQNPRSQFFTMDTDSELAFGCENRGWPAEKIHSRTNRVMEDFELDELMGRSLFKLSGGEKQRVACASVAAPQPEIFVLDEPSSNLDIHSIDKLALILEILKKEGKTILIAEHRISYLIDIADRVIYMKDGMIERDMPVREFLSISQAEINSMGLRPYRPGGFAVRPLPKAESLELQAFHFTREKHPVLDIKELSIPKGAISGILGDNGAGKTTLARCLCGLEKKAQGKLLDQGILLNGKQRLKSCYIVMQDVNHQLFTESVLDEVILSLPDSLSEDEKNTNAEAILQKLHLTEVKERHPQSLSGGQKQRVAIASAIASRKDIIIYDEPTSGLDLRHMREVAAVLREMSEIGITQLVITHDPELLRQCCDYIIFLENGRLSWCGNLDNSSAQKLDCFFYGQ